MEGNYSGLEANIKVYHQIMTMSAEAEIMQVLEEYSPFNRTFSSLEIMLKDPDEDFPRLVEALRLHIDAAKDSVILLYCAEGEDCILDLGVHLEIEYS